MDANDLLDAPTKLAVARCAESWALSVCELEAELLLTPTELAVLIQVSHLGWIEATLPKLCSLEGQIHPASFWCEASGGVPARRSTLGMAGGCTTLEIVADELRRAELAQLERSMEESSDDVDRLLDQLIFLRECELKARWRRSSGCHRHPVSATDCFDVLRQMVIVGVAPSVFSLASVVGSGGVRTRSRIVRDFFMLGEPLRILSPRKPGFLTDIARNAHRRLSDAD